MNKTRFVGVRSADKDGVPRVYNSNSLTRCFLPAPPTDGRRRSQADRRPDALLESYSIPIEAFLISTLAIAVGEIGDKTQLLALMLAARLQRPLSIVAGIAVATLLNHTVAGIAGAWVRHSVSPLYLRWIIAASFFAVALWALRPDSADTELRPRQGRFGAFAVTVVAFFLAEIGDKTQIATVVLAARFDNLPAVVAGTTFGMLIADVPAVLVGNAIAGKLPFRMLRWFAAALFALLGIAALVAPGLD